MPYTPPDFAELVTATDLLHHEYKSDQPSQTDRIDLINSIVKAKEAKDHDILLGAYCFGLEKIGGQYTRISPDKEEHYFRLFGSDLYTTLKNKLKISATNPLDLQQRFIYLVKFRHYINVPEHPLIGCLNELDNVIHFVLNRQSKKIDELLSLRPMNQVLMKNFYDIPNEYKSKANQSLLSSIRFSAPDPKRQRFLQFIRLIKKIYDEENPEHYEAMRAYDVIYGALLYFMEAIESTYRLRSPENSDLYVQCQKVMNIKKSQDVESFIKGRCYANLNCFIENYKSHLIWDTTQYGKIERFLSEMQTTIKAESDNFFMTYLAMLAAQATNYGVRIAIGTFSAGITFDRGLLTAIDLIGKAIKPEYALFLIVALPMLHDMVHSGAIGKIAGKLTPITFELMKLPIVFTCSSAICLKEFCGKMLYYNNDVISARSVLDLEWIEALVSLPDELFPVISRMKLATIVDLEQLKKTERTKTEKPLICAS